MKEAGYDRYRYKLDEQYKFLILMGCSEKEVAIAPSVIETMLENYYPHARYLKSAILKSDALVYGSQKIGAHGKFCIDSSCYGNSTGHFNAVEFMICFNQLGFPMFAQAIIEGLMPELGMNTLGEFREAQLYRCLIGKIQKVTFRKPINPREFSGELIIQDLITKKGISFYHIGGRFYDCGNGRSEGEMIIAITPAPVIPQT